MEAGQTVAVVGPGPIGSYSAAAKDAGARVVAVGGRPERRELAGEFDAEPGDGRGADVVVEAVGTAEAYVTRSSPSALAARSSSAAESWRSTPFRLHYEELTPAAPSTTRRGTLKARRRLPASAAYLWERLVTHRIGPSRSPPSSPTRPRIR